ncbi:type II toxin-antitoxin system HicB family antitoxin [Inquilinus sp. CAU 1745]|uniref:type II toxin-antitoxin system HicB family antitoxin n=1 Tax=Inquilinus sp. CAU 1745 TaxID=3140369 RepID=UPI00325A73E0
MTHYIAIIHKDADSDFGVSFPDFPGCVTAGSTLDEARAMAEEALAFHIEGMAEDGETIPAPSNLEIIMTSADFRDGVAADGWPHRAPCRRADRRDRGSPRSGLGDTERP